MRGLRLTPLITSIVGSVICIGLAVGLYFLLIVPTNAALADANAKFATVSSYYKSPAQLTAAKKSLADAQAAAAAVADQWNYIVHYKNPTIDVSDRFHAWIQWTNELEYDFAPRVEKYLKHTGVQPMTKISAPAPPSDPNAVPTAMIAMPLGTISVFGSYSQILNHVARWNRFDRIVLIDQLALSGYSPFVTGTYKATEYIFPVNGDNPGPPVPSGTGGGAASGSGPGSAMPGMPGMGGPGGPPPGYGPGSPGFAKNSPTR